MDDWWAALGLVLVIEGALYALFPEKMIDIMRRLPLISAASLRIAGVAAIALGWLVVWLVRG